MGAHRKLRADDLNINIFPGKQNVSALLSETYWMNVQIHLMAPIFLAIVSTQYKFLKWISKDCILNKFSLDTHELGRLGDSGTRGLKATAQPKVPHLAAFVCCQRNSEEKWKIHSFIWTFLHIQTFGVGQTVRWLTDWAVHVPHGWRCINRLRSCFRIGKYNVFYVFAWDPKANGVKWLFPAWPRERSSVSVMFSSPTKMQVQIFYCF